MKIVLNILCLILTVFCIYFPFSYFHKEADTKEVKVSHILVNTQQEALNIRKEITENKKSFEQMAKENSLCESKEDGGNIGYNMRGRLFKEFENAAFKLKKNEISQPVKTEAGWHLIKVYDVKYFSDKENFERRYF